jgi:hypothetical protein
MALACYQGIKFQKTEVQNCCGNGLKFNKISYNDNAENGVFIIVMFRCDGIKFFKFENNVEKDLNAEKGP